MVGKTIFYRRFTFFVFISFFFQNMNFHKNLQSNSKYKHYNIKNRTNLLDHAINNSVLLRYKFKTMAVVTIKVLKDYNRKRNGKN